MKKKKRKKKRFSHLKKRDVIKFFSVLFIETGQEFFRASSFSLILLCLCLFCFFDHVTVRSNESCCTVMLYFGGHQLKIMPIVPLFKRLTCLILFTKVEVIIQPPLKKAQSAAQWTPPMGVLLIKKIGYFFIDRLKSCESFPLRT